MKRSIIILLTLFFAFSIFGNANYLAKKHLMNKGEKLLNAGVHTDSKDRVQKLFAITDKNVYYSAKSGSNYLKKWTYNAKKRWKYLATDSNFQDINYDGIAELYFTAKSHRKNRVVLYVYDPVKNSVYNVVKKGAKLHFSKNLKVKSSIYNWMSNKINNLGSTTTVDNSSNQVEPEKLKNPKLKYLCDIWTDGTGNNRTKKKGGKYCGVHVKDLKDAVLVFQRVKGDIKFISVAERFSNGTWRSTYKGTMKHLKADSLRKTNKSTHLIFSVNGAHEKYLPTAAKVRVYKKVVAPVRKLPSIEEAKVIAKKYGKMKRGEVIFQIFPYEEQNAYKIAVLTNLHSYIFVEAGDKYLVHFKSGKSPKTVMLKQYNGMQDVDGDNVKDFFYASVDKRSKDKILNLVSVRKKSYYSAYGKYLPSVGEWDPEVEFRFSKNTPKKIEPWLKSKIYQFGFVKKPREISQTDPKYAIMLWFKNNGSLKVNEKSKLLTLNKYDGDVNFMKYTPGLNPVIAKVVVGNIEYKVHHKGVFSAYDRRLNKSYIIMASKNEKNFGTALYKNGKYIFVGLQNIGIVRFDTRENTLSHFRPKSLMNKDIWKIEKVGRNYKITIDSKKPVIIPAYELEK